jgi:hypothetical protein
MNLNPIFSCPLYVSSSSTTLYAAGFMSINPCLVPSVIIPSM